MDTYPKLESVLMEMSPAFEKLKNPILRKTVARVATLQQIAVVGSLNVDTIINRLRKEVGQELAEEESNIPDYLSEITPEWFHEKRIVKRFDASPLINSGGSPMNEILQQTKELGKEEIFELTTPFIPAPIIDMLKGRNFSVWCKQADKSVKCFIIKL